MRGWGSRSRASRGRRRAGVAAALVAAGVLLLSVSSAAAGGFKDEYTAGVAAFKAGDYEKALAQFTKAYKIEKVPLCLFGMAQAHRKLEHVDAAIDLYEKFLASKPPPAADLAAEVNGYLTELRAAKKSLAEMGEARKHYALGEFAEAAAAYERAWTLKASGDLLCLIAQSHERAGAKGKAADYDERCLKSDARADLKAEAETSLAALRPGGTGGASTGGGGRDGGSDGKGGGAKGKASSGAGGALSVDEGGPDYDGDTGGGGGKKGGSKVGLIAGVGGGAAVLVAGAVVLIVVLAGGKSGQPPPSDLGLGIVSY